MISLIGLIAWMGMGVICARRYGPDGSIPLAIFFGPFWAAIAADISVQRASIGRIDRGGDER